MSFTRPWVLLLLVVPVVLVVWEWTRPGHRLVMPFDHGPVDRVRRAWVHRLIRLAALLPSGLLAVAVLLLAGPSRLAPPVEERVVTNILFCLDVSGSMLSPFGDGTRSDKAREAIKDFAGYRKGDAFGITVFGSEVLHWLPVTRDLTALGLSVPFLRPDRMPPYMGGTAIAKALTSVRLEMLRHVEGDRMVILISDGESSDLHSGRAEELGEQLAGDRIVVYYIHVAEGAPQSETYALASRTGGQAFSAGDPAALREVFRQIDRMQSAKVRLGVREPQDHFRPLVVVGGVLVGLHLVAAFGLRFTPW